MNSTTALDEKLEVAAQVLIRCTIMGIVVLFIWWGALQLPGNLAYRIHSKFFPISREHFVIIHYTLILMTKAVVSLMFLFPFIALKLVIQKRKA